MRRTRTLLEAAGLFLGLTAMQPGGRLWGPNGNGRLDHADDLRWVMFHDATIKADEAKGIYQATFSRDLAGMDKHRLAISGYMLPVEPTTHSAHFVLTRRSTGCPFCPPNEPTEAIEIFADKAVDYRQSPVDVSGELHLVSRSETGLFYRLDHAEVH